MFFLVQRWSMIGRSVRFLHLAKVPSVPYFSIPPLYLPLPSFPVIGILNCKLIWSMSTHGHLLQRMMTSNISPYRAPILESTSLQCHDFCLKSSKYAPIPTPKIRNRYIGNSKSRNISLRRGLAHQRGVSTQFGLRKLWLYVDISNRAAVYMCQVAIQTEDNWRND